MVYYLVGLGKELDSILKSHLDDYATQLKIYDPQFHPNEQANNLKLPTNFELLFDFKFCL